MKILHILDHSLPLHSGYSFRSQNIVNVQKRAGLRPVVLTSPKHEESWHGDWNPKEIIDEVTYYRSGKIYSNRTIDFELRLMRILYKKILRIANYEKPLILHAHSPVLNVIPAIMAGRKLKIPVVYDIRAFWEDAGVDHGTYKENSLKYRLIKLLETWACKKASYLAVLCNGLRNDLIQRGIPKEKMVVIFNGINPEKFSYKGSENQLLHKYNLVGKRVIGYIGSFYRYEGLDLLIKAFSKVNEKLKDTILFLVGGGEMTKTLREQIAINSLENKVILTGRLPHDSIPDIYSMIDVLVYPRYSMRLTELVTPLKPLEAMAMGKTVIASDVGGHKELIKDNETGILFPAGNSKSLASVIIKTLEDEPLRKKVAERAKNWVTERHTWEKTTLPYFDIYKKALQLIRDRNFR